MKIYIIEMIIHARALMKRLVSDNLAALSTIRWKWRCTIIKRGDTDKFKGIPQKTKNYNNEINIGATQLHDSEAKASKQLQLTVERD